jgi:hypothetical protein
MRNDPPVHTRFLAMSIAALLAIPPAAHARSVVRPGAQPGDAKPASGDDAAELERSYAELERAYRAATQAYAEEIEHRRASGQKPDEKSAPNPATSYWPRFEALADKGSGHARLWMALEVHTAFLARDRAETQKQSLELLDGVVQCCADASWIGELSKNLSSLYVLLPEADVDRIVDALVARSKQREAVAEALSRSASAAKRSKRADAAERATALAEKLQRDFADTDAAKRARGEETRAVGLSVGLLAPDFTTKDADGGEFKLSDYRGKVVVLDFWGFW